MQMATKKQTEQYGNSSISMLKGEDRVRKRPAVIFGSDDLEGCKHAVFEILSNAIDEAREGHGDTIIVTRYEDLSVEVEDFGRGCPVDWNEKEKRYNWELVFCEMYAGGKYGENGENYEYSLGLNGLGSCATQYASDFFDVTVRRDGFRYDLHFEKGRIKGEMQKTEADRKKTGSKFHWRPDKEVFTVFAVLAAGVHFAENQFPVVPLFLFVPVHGAAPTEVLHLYGKVFIPGDDDGIPVAFSCFVDGVGENLKHRMLAAFQIIGAEDDCRTFPDTVLALQHGNTGVAVLFRLLFRSHFSYLPIIIHNNTSILYVISQSKSTALHLT